MLQHSGEGVHISIINSGMSAMFLLLLQTPFFDSLACSVPSGKKQGSRLDLHVHSLPPCDMTL